MRKTKFAVGNQVCVKQSDGGTGTTVYEVVTIHANGLDCTIREIGLHNGKPYRAQRFDTSLLTHAVTDEMLAAFSGGLKARR
jgi:hypothetical protein